MTKYPPDFPTSHDLNMMVQHHLDLLMSEGLYFRAHPRPKDNLLWTTPVV